ncbi:hypothetical protein [Burkholderia multivorans]|uniref:hypothetical protein n=1 Tax=Burkholderia multivorans TaxID=87883 RepID=UPI0035105D1D
MKRLYARLVLWLIRPALDVALSDRDRQGDSTWRMKCAVSVSGRHWVISKDGAFAITRGEERPS